MIPIEEEMKGKVAIITGANTGIGFGCAKVFSEAGITATTVSRMERAGEVVRIARGLYQLPDAALDAQALADLKAASPFPAMPVELTAATHALTIRILYRETQ